MKFIQYIIQFPDPQISSSLRITQKLKPKNVLFKKNENEIYYFSSNIFRFFTKTLEKKFFREKYETQKNNENKNTKN